MSAADVTGFISIRYPACSGGEGAGACEAMVSGEPVLIRALGAQLEKGFRRRIQAGRQAGRQTMCLAGSLSLRSLAEGH